MEFLMKRRIFRTLAWLGPDIVALIIFTLVWLGMVIVYGGKIHIVEGSILLPTYILILFVLIAFVGHLKSKSLGSKHHPQESFGKRVKRIVRDWLPVIFLVMVYETLRDYTGLIRPDYIDDTLYRLDVAIFGVEPVLWIQKFIHPFLTDYFTLMYILYIVLPLGLAAILYRARRYHDFRETALGCVLCLYAGFLLYIIFPAGPPRFYSAFQFDPVQLTGLFGLYEFTHNQMDRSSYVMHRASFPSLHIALAALGMLQAWRFGGPWKRNWLGFLFTWIAVGVWISTVYLRHHWTVDIFAGWFLAITTFYAAKFTCKYWKSFEQCNYEPKQEKTPPARAVNE